MEAAPDPANPGAIASTAAGSDTVPEGPALPRCGGAANDTTRSDGACAPQLAAGMCLGKWTLLSELGRGASGVVFRARAPGGVEVALKVLARDGERARRRFTREAEIAAGLDHPGILRVHELGQAGGHLVIASELVEGACASGWVLPGLPLSRRAALVRDAARALGYAHARGVVHRDVKSDNLLVAPDGRVLVIDFGLAWGEELSRLTRSGHSVGTPTHMAPEQVLVERAALGPPTDVWGLGVVLYQALTGALPFPGPSWVEMHDQILAASPVPPRVLVPELSPALEAVCLRALAREPGQRFADGEAMARALDEALAPARAVPAAIRGLAGAAAFSVCLAVGALAHRALALSATVTPAPRGLPGIAPRGLPGIAAAPEWLLALPPAERPPWPLPPALEVTGTPGEVLCRRDGSRLVWIPPARFTLGSQARPDEGPPRGRELPGFFLARHELTWGRWERFCAASGRAPPSRRIEGYGATFQAGDEHPVFHVSWEDARAYCAWAGLRLPGEAEWERAARGPGLGRVFPWGDAFPRGATRLANVADRSAQGLVGPEFGRFEADLDDGAFFPAPVGSYPEGATPEGVLDLAGNVWEWTADVYARYDDPEPPAAGPRAVRGGAWDNPIEFARTTNRGRFESGQRAAYLGFRVAW